MTESKIQMLYDNDDNPICPITSAKAVFDDDGISVSDKLSEPTDWSEIQNKPEFANVATSGSYNDLSHKPTIPSMEMVDSKVDKEDGKTLSSNDFTDEYKSAIDNIPTSYAPVNAQANVIETIKVNGKALTPADKAVSITVPAAVTETTVSGWGFTKNTGTITEVKMNGNSMGSSGVIDLGSVITSLPDISHKVDDTRKVNGKALSSDVTLSANDILTDDNMSIQKRLDELESFESITYKGTVASFDELPTNAANGDMYYCTADKLHYVCVNDPLIDFYEWHEYHTFDDDYIITVEKVANNLTTVSEGYVLDARQGKELKDAIDNLPSMDNVVLHKDPLGEPSEAVPRDADTLGGKNPEYYAKQSEVSELNQNLTDLETKFAIVQGKLSSSTSGVQKVADYPDGFTIQNCIIIGKKLVYSEGVECDEYNTSITTVRMKADGIYVGNTGSNYINKPIVFVLFKYV